MKKYVSRLLIFGLAFGLISSQSANAGVIPYKYLTDSQFSNNQLDDMWKINNEGTGWSESFGSNGLTFKRDTTLPQSGGNRIYAAYNAESIDNKTIVSSGVYNVEVKMAVKSTDVAGQTSDLFIALTNPSMPSSLGEKRNYSFTITNNKANLRNVPNDKGVSMQTEVLSTYRFVLDFTARTTDVYINGAKQVSGYPFIGANVNSFEAIEFQGRQITANDYVNIKSVKGWYDSQALFSQEASTLTVDTLTDQDPTQISKSLTLPLQIGKHISVGWVSSKSDIISNTGVVIPDKNSNIKVLLTATLEATGADGTALKTTKTFDFTVLFKLTDEFSVFEDTNNLIIDDATNYIITSSKITLLQQGSKYGSAITWVSSHPEVISLSGVVTKPNYDTVVTLAARITKGDVSTEKMFKYLVEGYKRGNETLKTSISKSSKGSSSNIVVYSSDSKSKNDIVNKSYFTDLGQVSWSEEYINKLYDLKIISGVSEGKFEPNREIKREEFIKILVTAFEMDENEQKGDLPFDDVHQNDWFYPYIRVVTSQGIVSGIASNIFGTGTQISRQDAAVLLYRVLILKTDSIKTERTVLFNDSREISDYAKMAVEALATVGIFSGNESNEIQPLHNITRAQAAKIICLSMDLLRR